MGRPLLLIVILLAGGCASSSVNDELRARLVELEDQVAELERRNGELEIELSRTAAADGDDQAIRASTPRAVSLEIGRLSHARDDDGDGAPDRLIIYLVPRDGRARFVQVVGELMVTAFIVSAEGEPRRIGGVALGPIEVRDAYRSGATGTHYTVQMPVAGSDGPRASVHAELADAQTGETLIADAVVDLVR